MMFTLFVGCQKDDDTVLDDINETSQDSNIFDNLDISYKTLTLNQVPRADQRKLEVTKNNFISNNETRISIEDFVIDTLSVRQFSVVNKLTSYTFSIRPNPDDTILQDIVISNFKDGSSKTYLIEYELDLSVREIVEMRNEIKEHIISKNYFQLNDSVSGEENSLTRGFCIDVVVDVEVLVCEGEAGNTSPECFNDDGSPATTTIDATIATNCDESDNNNNNDGGGGGGNGDEASDEGANPDYNDQNTGGGGGDGGDGNSNNNNNDDDDDNPSIGILVTSPPFIGNLAEIFINRINQYIEPDLTEEQEDFLRSNIQFAEAAFDALENGGEVDFDENIIYNLGDKPCQKDIIETTLSLSSDFTNLINNTFDSNGQTNLNLSATDIPNGNNAFTVPFVSGDQSAYYVDIKFDNTYLNNATDLSIAAVTLHELVHAYLVNLFVTNQMGSESESFNDLLNAFIGFYDEQVQDTANTLDNEIHNAMNDFIDNASMSLFNYAQEQGIDADLEYCNHLMWGTMFGTELFEDVLTEEQQANYGNIAGIEQENTTFEGQSPKGSGCE